MARSLGPIVTYTAGPRAGAPVAPDVVRWFWAERPQAAAAWARAHPGFAQAWGKADDAVKAYVADWFKDHPADLAGWRRAKPDKADPTPRTWPCRFREFRPGTPGELAHHRRDGGTNAKGDPVWRVRRVGKDASDTADLAAVFFDDWRQAHPTVELTAGPADRVLASGSGHDPTITLANARSQLDRVAGAWADQTGQDPARVRADIEDLSRAHAAAPLLGLAGVDLVNVMDVNLALRDRYHGKRKAKS